MDIEDHREQIHKDHRVIKDLLEAMDQGDQLDHRVILVLKEL